MNYSTALADTMYRHHRARLILSCIAALIWILPSSTSLAASSDVGTDIQVQADYMKFDMETGNSIYKGNVKISQGNIELTGDKVIIQRQQDKIQQINIEGQPARYTQDEDSENKIYASSQHMQYLANKHRLIMTVNAQLKQPDHTIESQRIVYDTKNKTVIAGNNAKNPQGGRVNITLTPKQDNSASPAKTEQP